eukprot:TRINITY_DN4433_c2_g2_i1.p1 TRINITY_DN4433_c2_g2~~TRINITY_DN4433_c2_g2_i1.p1  ORF type:complete len:830 (+),score=96.59 TRINITY_DN4433_c2_g2_i1:48-2537(+)
MASSSATLVFENPLRSAYQELPSNETDFKICSKRKSESPHSPIGSCATTSNHSPQPSKGVGWPPFTLNLLLAASSLYASFYIGTLLAKSAVAECQWRSETSWWQCGQNAGFKCGFDDTFLTIPSTETAAENFRSLTSVPHVAGTKACLQTAEFVESKLKEYGLHTDVSDYSTALSYPISRSLSIVHPFTQSLPLNEAVIAGDPFSARDDIIPPYLAYVPSGNVTAEVVYVNYGRTEDYEELAKLGVKVAGSITIARYGEIFRGDKITNAAKFGAVAAILYSDPEDAATDLKADGVYPDSKWLPPSGVQRGSVLPRLHGDPTTPGWPSLPGAEHLPISDPRVSLPKIPAIPISYEAAEPILSGLGGKTAPENWWGGIKRSSHGVGRGPLKVNLDLKMEMRLGPIRNVHAIIEGSDEPDRYVVVGNHHDAWTFGAVDPNSGTTAFLEVARGLGELLEMGWRPRRTIIMCNWDAEEMGLLGSTEWVEENADALTERAVAYINLDSATSGPGYLHAGATPQLDFLLMEAAAKVKDPDTPSLSLLETWFRAANTTSTEGFTLPLVPRLGGCGTDYAGFLEHLGIATINLEYNADDSGYPMYHTSYDNPAWFEKFADPGFKKTVAVSQVYGLLTLWLADLQVLPFNYMRYCEEMTTAVAKIEEKLVLLKGEKAREEANAWLGPLRSALGRLETIVEGVEKERVTILQALRAKGGFWPSWGALSLESSAVLRADPEKSLQNLNDRLMRAERGFVAPDGSGLPGWPWFRHLMFGPVQDNGYAAQTFPGIAYAIQDTATQKSSSWHAVLHEIHRAARAVTRVGRILQKEDYVRHVGLS